TLKNQISAFVPIMVGCNNYCSYCIVPYVRGKEKSLPVENILDEIKYLLKNGVKEITLLGQNVNSYHSPKFVVHSSELNNKSTNDYVNFEQLLEKIAELKFQLNNNFWIRFMTNHPKDMNEKIVTLMKNYANICKHIHLPLQSGSDKILNLMNRNYTAKKYYELIQMIRDIIPEISITTDLIVGFPSETEEDFMQTYNLVEKIQFDSAFVFKYSPREGTKAAEFLDDVPKETKEKRHFKLLSLCESIAKNINYKYINKIYQGLIFEKKEKNTYYARLESNRTVQLNTEKKLELGNFVNIKVVDIKKHNLIGTIVD
ncbi:MAG: MiaB/RimO family radical SAM methylthiotransferase, partial [Endomicrobiia bacterium]